MDLVHEYFEPVAGDGREGFTGAWFERIPQPDLTRFTAEDLVAVTMLSVAVPPKAAKVLLMERQDDFARRLADIRPELTIESAEGRDFLRGDENGRTPGDALWQELRSLDGVGPTIASKLIARKRPALIPVHDSVIESQLGPSMGHWQRFAAIFDDEPIRDALSALRSAADADHASLLRVLDALLWRDGSGHGLPATRPNPCKAILGGM